MKREREFLDASPIFWNGNIISVFKIVAYYGFDNMQDISMFSTISKYFYDWMNDNVIARGILTITIHERVNVFKTMNNYPLPRVSLLNKCIVLHTHKCTISHKRNLICVTLVCIFNNNIILAASYGKNISKTYRNDESLRYMKPSIGFKTNNGDLIIYVSKA